MPQCMIWYLLASTNTGCPLLASFLSACTCTSGAAGGSYSAGVRRDVSKYTYGCSEFAGTYCQKLIRRRRFESFGYRGSGNSIDRPENKLLVSRGASRVTSAGKIQCRPSIGSCAPALAKYDGPPSPEIGYFGSALKPPIQNTSASPAVMPPGSAL